MSGVRVPLPALVFASPVVCLCQRAPCPPGNRPPSGLPVSPGKKKRPRVPDVGTIAEPWYTSDGSPDVTASVSLRPVRRSQRRAGRFISAPRSVLTLPLPVKSRERGSVRLCRATFAFAKVEHHVKRVSPSLPGNFSKWKSCPSCATRHTVATPTPAASAIS